MPNHCAFPQVAVAPRGSTSSKKIIDKHYSVGNNAVFTDFYQLTDEAMRLHAGSLAYDDPSLDFYKRSDKTAIINNAII